MKAPEYFKEFARRGWLEEAEVKQLYKDLNGSAHALTLHLLEKRRVLRKELGKVYGDALGIAYVHMPETLIQKEAVALLPENFARSNQVMPLYLFGNAVVLALPNLDRSIVMQAENLLKKPVEVVLSFPDEIRDAIEIHYAGDDGFQKALAEDRLSPVLKELAPERITLEDLQRVVGSKAVVELVRSLILMAVRDEASDIHVEPYQDYFRVRYRVDGVLREVMRLDKSFLQPLLSRFKVLAKLDITEARKAQEGRLALELNTASVDLRIALVPTINGEKAVLRILGRPMKRKVPDLPDLGFSARELEKAERLLATPGGILLATGPSGCGKTATIHAIVKRLNTAQTNIMAVEDPVEVRFEGVNQVQADTATGLGMAEVLKSFLRQDPDVIFIGEIRDPDTARLAVEAALVGYGVLSTLHATAAVRAVARLTKWGVAPYLIAPALAGVINQRLVRKICPHCKEPYDLGRAEMDALFIHDGARKVTLAKGKGCSLCDLTGYRGRVAVHEVLVVDDAIRELIFSEAPGARIRQSAAERGFTTLWHDGMRKVLRHLTTLAEIERVIGNE